MKSTSIVLPLALSFVALTANAMESTETNKTDKEYIPLNYNSHGLDTDAQNAILEREADYVENQYKDLDQDKVPDKQDLCLNTIFGVKVDQNGCELDSDQDGVFDRLDQCPDTAPGAKVNIFGCEGDDDNDGVVNSKDRCPNTPEGVAVDEFGCEIRDDDDGDGVKNSDDQCPNTPKGAKVNEYGCEPVSFVMTNIKFDFNKHNIRSDQATILKSEAAALQNLKEGEVLLITGHTDTSGPEDYNLALSWKRANSTKQFIVKEFNREAGSIFILGEGETKPIADNQTNDGRKLNRRIEFKIIKADELPKRAEKQIPVNIQ